jgi:WD40 repeat protein
MRSFVVVGAGVLAVIVVIAAIAFAPRSTVIDTPAPTSAPITSTARPSQAASQIPASSAPGATTSPRQDLASLLHPLVASWRASGPVLLVEHSDGPGATLLAVPLHGGTATPLVTLPNPIQLGYALRDDGSVLAVALAISTNTARIAIWDLASGSTRWLTEEESGVTLSTPVWSEDGSLLYYAAHTSAGQAGLVDLGIFRVRSDGTQKTRVRAPDENGAQLRGLTPDGRGLVWDRIRAGGAVEVLDLASGVNHSFDETTTASVVSWRGTQPRALVMVGGCCAGRPGGSLALWNDATGSSTMLLGIQSTPPVAVTSAAWEPNGARFAAAVVDRASVNYFGSVLIYDADGEQLAAVAATDGAQQVLWLPMGIVFTRASGARGIEIVLASVNGGTQVSLYKDPSAIFIRSVVGP